MDKLPQPPVASNPEIQKVIRQFRDALQWALPEGSFAERERAALDVGNEVVRQVLQEELQALANEFGGEVLVDGARFRRHQQGTVTYHSLCGPLVVTRSTYRQAGKHNGPTVVALELAAGLAERTTPALAYSIAHGYAVADMRIHGESLGAARRIPPSRTTLERVAKRLAEAAVEDAPSIEVRVRRRESLPRNASGISVGLDRTAVAMGEPRPANAPAKRPAKRTRPRQRRAPPPFDVNWRMAYVGTVTITDWTGEALQVRRYAAPACDDPAPLVERMMSDVEAALSQQPTLHVGIVQDGAPEMWNAVRAGLERLREQGLVDDWVEAIDRYHLLERVGEVLGICISDPNYRSQQFEDWRQRLADSDEAIDDFELVVKRAHRVCQLRGDERLREHLTYIRNNKDRMRYRALRRYGLPVGSGATESAAKTVVAQRAKKSGQRWSEPGLRGVLTLRGLQLSDRLPAFWSRFATRYAADVREAA